VALNVGVARAPLEILAAPRIAAASAIFNERYWTGYLMTQTDDMLSQQLRRRADGSLDMDFYRRRAAKLRSDELGRRLRVAWCGARHWGAAARALTWRGGQAIVTTVRGAGTPVVATQGDGRRA